MFTSCLGLAAFVTLSVSALPRINYHGYQLYRFEPKNGVFDYLNSEIEPRTNRFDVSVLRASLRSSMLGFSDLRSAYAVG